MQRAGVPHVRADIGADAPLSTMLAGDDDDCFQIVGNPECVTPGGGLGPAPAYTVCNRTWHERSVGEFCGENFARATVGRLAARQTWPPLGVAAA